MNPYAIRARRGIFVRTVAGIAGDVAIGIGLAGTCAWIIQSAALGLFLSFLLWIAALLLSLAVSQYVVRPTIRFALSDAKLDRGLEALSALAQSAKEAGAPLWQQLSQGIGRFVVSRVA